MNQAKENRIDPTLMDMDQLEKDLQMDFGMKQEKQEKPAAPVSAAQTQPKSADPADFDYNYQADYTTDQLKVNITLNVTRIDSEDL